MLVIVWNIQVLVCPIFARDLLATSLMNICLNMQKKINTSTKPKIKYYLFFGSLNYIDENDIIGFTKNLILNGRIKETFSNFKK